MTHWLATVPLPEPGRRYFPRLLPAEKVRGVEATIITWPISYVFLRVGADGFFDEVDIEKEREWEQVRLWLSGAADVKVSATIPKLGLVALAPDGPLFRTRMGRRLGWHPGAPGGGLLAFGAAALREGTVPSVGAGDPNAVEWTVRTPAGLRTIAYRLTPTGAPGLAIAICTTNLKEIR